jgi:hypothetical protein
MFPYGVAVEVLTSTRDNHGDTVDTVRGVIAGCGIAPETSTEDNDNRAQVDTRTTVYAPYSPVTVGAQDKVRILPPGDLSPEAKAALPKWHVDGEPGEWANPFTGWRPGRVIQLRRVTG